MRKVLFITIIFTLMWPEHISASMLCQHDWLADWRNHSGMLPNARVASTNSSRSGAWAVGADIGGAGQQSVVGISMCTAIAGHSGDFRPDGAQCWCKMTSPTVGANWVRHIDFGADPNDCHINCAQLCADGVRSGGIRSAVLDVPN